ncbi:MAG TPA: hypothetical protein PKH07_04755, partial [bacterium]|nr:hypothetical protein [bacterium]
MRFFDCGVVIRRLPQRNQAFFVLLLVFLGVFDGTICGSEETGKMETLAQIYARLGREAQE